MKPKSTACVLWAILIVLAGLTGCASESSVPKVLPSLYQPPVLRLPQGVTVQTRDGPYQPPADETWHSDARFRALEQENVNLTAAVAQLRNGR